MGALFGLALLSKFNLAAIILPFEVALIWSLWRSMPSQASESRNNRQQQPTSIHTAPEMKSMKAKFMAWLKINGIIFITTFFLAGWWFIRNQMLYGEPTGFEAVTQLWGVRSPVESIGLAISELPYAWTTLWGRFGFGQIPLPEGIYDGLKVLVALSLIGVILGYHRASRRQRRALNILMLNIVLFFGVLFFYMLVSPAGPNGRFFFPALSSLALLIFFGLYHIILVLVGWIRRIRDQTSPPQVDSRAIGILGVVVNVGMFSLSLVSLIGYLAPAYSQPKTLKENVIVPNPVNIQFDSIVTLLGYETSMAEIQPGEPIDVDLYWEVTNKPPGNYLLFLHLQDEVDTIVAQRDTHPGLGNFPSSNWQVGSRFVESVRLYVPETAYVPSIAQLRVGLYAPDGYRLGIFEQSGSYIGDSFNLAAFTLESLDSKFPNFQNQNFNDEIVLRGYEYSKREIVVGETNTITLYWEALKKGVNDYMVQVRLVDDVGQVLAMSSNRPADGMSPTKNWKSGQQVIDRHELLIEPSTPPGRYAISIRLLDTENEQFQNIVGEDGHWIDSQLLLAELQIRSE